MDYFSESQANKGQIVQKMFDEVAPKYDCFNNVLSMGMDTLWRNKAIKILLKELPSQGPIIDMGCGSGDLAGDLFGKHKVVGADFCHGMLKEAQKKFQRLPLSQADATNLPFSDDSVRGMISAFVIRNIEGLPKGFKEFNRVIKPGGKLVILEFSLPKNPIIRFGFTTYLKIMFPIACKLFKGDGEAYQYLRKSIQDFGTKIDVVSLLNEAGFSQCKQTPLLMGGVSLYEATKT